jgi:hypothetical protein
MPRVMWKPACSCTNTAHSTYTRTCETCGVPGTYAGYQSSSPHEAWGRFARTYCVNPFGAHTAFARALLEPLRRTCDECGGASIVTRRFQWSYCARCNGTGITWAAPGAELAAAYRRIFEERPDALLIDRLLEHLKAIGACERNAVTVEQALGIERPGELPEPVASAPPPMPRRSGLPA